MRYDDWVAYANQKGVSVVELPLDYCSGMIVGNTIGIDSKKSTTEKSVIMSEEVGHLETSVGNILDQGDVCNRKQEHRARRWAHNHMISQQDLVNAAKHGCRSAYDTAEFLDVTEEFLEEAIQDFRQQYGSAYYSEDFMIQYEPYLLITDLEEGDQ